MIDALQREIAAREAEGQKRLSVAAMDAEFRRLGYHLDRSLDCRGTAQYVSGPRAGESYPCVTTGLKEFDTGLSAFNVSARRDARFREVQALRQNVFAVSRGAILEA